MRVSFCTVRPCAPEGRPNGRGNSSSLGDCPSSVEFGPLSGARGSCAYKVLVRTIPIPFMQFPHILVPDTYKVMAIGI